MNRSLKVTLSLGLICSSTLGAPPIRSAGISSHPAAQGAASPNVKVMREYKGVKLGLNRDQVTALMGKPENSSDGSEDYRLGGDDLMTVHYDNGQVKAIQLAFLDPKNAPAWNDVVGDAEVSQTENGAKHARKVVSQENFWVSIYQSKDSQITRITISK